MLLSVELSKNLTMLMKCSEMKEQNSERKLVNSNIVSLKSNIKKTVINLIWYLDIGASNHICGDENFFVELTKVEVSFVSFENDSIVAIKGHRTIRHIQKKGHVGEIMEVYYVLELKSNILSMSQLLKKGILVLIKDQILYLKVIGCINWSWRSCRKCV